jgi:Domain of unknown function (DUF4331)
VVDIALQAVEGAAQTGKLVDAIAAGDKVDANDAAFGSVFPYVALPSGSAVNTGAASAPAPAPTAAGPSASPTAAGATGYGGPVMMALGTAAVLGLGTAFFVGWWRRRRPIEIAIGATHAGPQPPAEM